MKIRLFLKENNKYNFYNLDLTPKTILTSTNIVLPMSEEERNKIFSRENTGQEKEKKFYSPQPVKKFGSFQSIVKEIEPYLIKKFQE